MRQIDIFKGGIIERIGEGESIEHLTPEEVEKLTNAFRNYYMEEERKIKNGRAKYRGRYYLVYLFLRYTGARVSEVLNIDEKRGLDVRNSEVTLITLKRHSKKKKNIKRVVPVPVFLMSEYLDYIHKHQDMYGKVFKISRFDFYKLFKKLAIEVGVPPELAHPHILRHTRAVELLRAGVPVTIVQQILGHSTLTTTAIYLKYTSKEAKIILRDRGML